MEDNLEKGEVMFVDEDDFFTVVEESLERDKDEFSPPKSQAEKMCSAFFFFFISTKCLSLPYHVPRASLPLVERFFCEK